VGITGREGEDWDNELHNCTNREQDNRRVARTRREEKRVGGRMV